MLMIAWIGYMLKSCTWLLIKLDYLRNEAIACLTYELWHRNSSLVILGISV